MNSIETLSVAIREIIELKGNSVFQDSRLFCAVIDDLVPQLVTERNILHRVLNDDLLREIGTILEDASEYSKNASLAKFERKLIDYYGVREDWCRIIILSFSDAFKKEQSDNYIGLLEAKSKSRIIMVGIGGAGNNTINRAINEQINGIEFVAINADKNALQLCNASKRILVGEKSFKGLGVGVWPELGKEAVEESAELIREAITGADIVFICCGMGGGMGTGGAPVVARIAKEMGILTVGIATKPFRFEAQIRKTNAISGIERLKKFVDTLIVIPNDITLEVVDRNTTMTDALGRLDNVVFHGMQGIKNFVESNTKNNVSLAELGNIMNGKGLAHVGYSTSKGKGKIISALQLAINSPWLEDSIKNAVQVLLHLHGDILELDTSYAVRHIQDVIGHRNVIYSVIYDKSMSDEVEVIIIAYDGTEKLNNAEKVNNDKTLQDKRGLVIPDFLKRSSIKKEEIPTIPDSLKRK